MCSIYLAIFLLLRSQIKVIIHDDSGMEISRIFYDDVIEDCDSNSTSEPSSPELKEDFVLFKQENKQGAARLDFIPKSNINDLIFKRKHSIDGKDSYQNNENNGRHDSKHRDNIVKSQNTPFEKVSPSPFPQISIIPNTSQAHNFSSNLSGIPTNMPHCNFSINQIPYSICTGHPETSNVIFGNSNASLDQLNKDNSPYRLNQSALLKQMSNTNNQFGNHFILPQTLGSNSNSLQPPSNISNIVNSNPESIIQTVLPKQDSLQQPTLHYTDNSIPISSNSELLPTSSNPCLPSRSITSGSNVYLSNLPSHLSLDSMREINQGLFHQTLQNNQLQPQIPRPNQLEPASNSQLQSVPNTILSNTNELQNSSQSNSTTPCIPLPQLNNLHTLMSNNILFAPIQESRMSNLHNNPVTSANLLDSLPCNFGQNKQGYQQYLTLLQSHLYSQQLHAFLSQMQSPTQSLQAQIQAQVASSPIQVQLSQLSQIPSQIISTQNQASLIRPQSHPMSLTGYIPYSNNSNDIFHPLSNFSFANDREQNQIMPKNTEKK